MRAKEKDIAGTLADFLWRVFSWPEFAPPEVRGAPEWRKAAQRDLEKWKRGK